LGGVACSQVATLKLQHFGRYWQEMRALWAVDHVVKSRSMCFRGQHAEFYEVLTLECRPSRRRRVEISVATRVRGYGLSLNLGGGPDNEIKIQFILDT
jgi:hypothetical protein